MMNEIQIFQNSEFGEVRTIMINGEPWFVGKDVSVALGYAKPTDAIRKHVDEEDRGISKMETPSGIQEMVIINESGLYSLIFGSKLESAKKFKRWVTSEVIPQIRRTGTYGAPKIPENPMELLELHYEAIKHVDKRVDSLEDRFNTFEKSLPLLPNEADEVSNAVKKRVVEILGGKESNAYRNRGICQKAFKDAYRELKRNFDCSRYKDIKREQKDKAVELAGMYVPPLYLKEQIEQANAQMRMEL